MTLGHEEVRRLLALVDASPSLDDIDLTIGEVRLRIRRSPPKHGTAVAFDASAGNAALAATTAVQAHAEVVHAPSVAPTPHVRDDAVQAGHVAVLAPMLGSFYRAASPGEPPFVELGQTVQATDTVCLIEVMKLFSSVAAGVDGVVAEIRPANGDLVEHNQVLIVIAPRSAA